MSSNNKLELSRLLKKEVRTMGIRVNLMENPLFKEIYEKHFEENVQQGMEQGIQQGMEQGIQQGMEQGIRQGMERGIQQGINKATQQIVRQMLAEGLPIALITKVTQLSAEEIQRLH
ncbi:hypothetical protein [Beggiatoa leptomitoformis]|uniref:Transposase n=2 Tax=Beggiatoa leptomitoformis TaxID=288004 RepID=A0A2N9Y9V0_9GAMM|nr:hypothetical protein [Beggiatoa leptomitoformis]AUI67231.2 hypothetical protein BLE401_00020 [Beggiatoa leptomitoformis]